MVHPRLVVAPLACLLACATSIQRDSSSQDDVASLGSESESSDTETTTSSTDTETSATTETTDSETTETTDTTETTGEPGASLGVFDLTYYWVSYEGDFAAGSTVDIGTCGGSVIANVRAGFADALKVEGSGKLLDDRIVNVGGCGCGGGYDCFVELDPVMFPWGQGSQGNPLIPYHTIATDTGVLPFGTSIYAPDLAGQSLPDGTTHDGCLRAGDVGGGIDGMHIDWFVGLEGNYQTLDPDVPETVELFEGGTICP
jgi:hypothetical protein